MCENKNEIIGEVWEELKLMLDIYVKKNIYDMVEEHMRRTANIQNQYIGSCKKIYRKSRQLILM